MFEKEKHKIKVAVLNGINMFCVCDATTARTRSKLKFVEFFLIAKIVKVC